MSIRTGANYIKALRDGREVWHAGRRIDDVTAHAGFSGTIKTLADLYDKQHTPEYQRYHDLDYEGERMSYSYLPPQNAKQLPLKRRNIEFWSQATFGQMGRFPEFVAELIVGLLDWTHVIEKTNEQWAENARAYHRYVSRNDLCLTHALTDQYYDRTKPVGKQDDPDLILHIVGETKEGPVVRGLRTLATLAPIADEVIVYPNRPREPDEADYAMAFAIPMNTKGLKILCRDLYAENADPERQPLTTRFDEVDAALIFDDVVVPWERLFVYKDPKLLSGIMYIHTWGQYSTMLRLVTKLEAFLGVAQLLTQYAKRNTSLPSQILLSSLIQDIEILRSCIQVGESNGLRCRRRHLGAVVECGVPRPQHRSFRPRRTDDGSFAHEHIDAQRRRVGSAEHGAWSICRALLSRRRAEYQGPFTSDGDRRGYGDDAVRQAQPIIRALAERRSRPHAPTAVRSIPRQGTG